MAKKGKKKAKLMLLRRFLQCFVRITGNIPGWLYFRTKRVYVSKKAKKHIKGPAILVSNHNGFYDPVYLLVGIWYRRLWFVASTKIYNTKFKSFFFSKASFMIPIDSTKGDIGAIRDVIDRLKEGEVVTLFPEGHIAISEEGLDAFKQGMVLMAMMGNAPIVPIYLKKREKKRQRLTIGIGEPIQIDPEARKNQPLDYMKKMTDFIFERMTELEHLVEDDHK